MYFWILPYALRATCPAHLSRLDLRFLILLREEYNACSSALCNLLQSPAILSLLAPNIFVGTLFSNTLNLCSSLKVGYQVSQPYNWYYITITRTIVRVINMFQNAQWQKPIFQELISRILLEIETRGQVLCIALGPVTICIAIRTIGLLYLFYNTE